MWYRLAIIINDDQLESELRNNANSSDDIKSNYRMLARQYHPDVNQDPDSTENFKNLTRVYEEIRDQPLYTTNEIRNEATEDSVRDNIELQDNFLNTDEEALKMGLILAVETYFNNNVPEMYDTPGFDVYENITEIIYQNIKDINPTPYKPLANLINSIAGKYIKENY
jgi:hypothetical protein